MLFCAIASDITLLLLLKLVINSMWIIYRRCGQPVVTHVMNPKSMHRERLLGHMDVDTREWADGVLTDAARKVVREPSEVRCWIICDGDVDPEVNLSP